MDKNESAIRIIKRKPEGLKIQRTTKVEMNGWGG